MKRRQWVEIGGRHGSLCEGVFCHVCGGRIVYNGNYFCTLCDWVNPAVLCGVFTTADCDFADKLFVALTGEEPNPVNDIRYLAKVS